jgi:integrase
MRKTHRLTPMQVSKLTAPGKHADGGGLYLKVATGGSKSWVFRYARAGDPHEMGLGSITSLSLSEARVKARSARQQILNGEDPLTLKKAGRVRAPSKTFRECASGFLNSHSKKWGVKHRAQWLNTLSQYAFPTIGALPIDQVATQQVMSVLEPIWGSKTETAARVRGRIESVLNWATTQELRQGDNPARWRGHLSNLLAARAELQAVKHHPALPYAEVPAFMSELRERGGTDARALEFLTLTATRTSETLNARWDEIDIEQRLWTVPSERTKTRKELCVPLSARAIEILNSLPRTGDLIFAGTKEGKPIHERSMRDLLVSMRGNYTPHGMRSTFRDWCGDRTPFPHDVAEAALGHAIKDKTVAAYRRESSLEKRRLLMDSWAAYCSEPPASGDVVVPIRA